MKKLIPWILFVLAALLAAYFGIRPLNVPPFGRPTSVKHGGSGVVTIDLKPDSNELKGIQFKQAPSGCTPTRVVISGPSYSKMGQPPVAIELPLSDKHIVDLNTGLEHPGAVVSVEFTGQTDLWNALKDAKGTDDTYRVTLHAWYEDTNKRPLLSVEEADLKIQ